MSDSIQSNSDKFNKESNVNTLEDGIDSQITSFDDSDSDSELNNSPGIFLGKCSIYEIFKSTGHWLLYNTSVWKKQRTLNASRSKHILEYQNKIKTHTGNFEFIVPFYITEYKGNRYTFDGQHRINAISLMTKKQQRDLDIIVFSFKCDHECDIIRWFQNINLATPMPLPDLFQSDSRKIISDAIDIIHKKHKKFVSVALGKPRKPNIKLEDLKNEIYERDIVHALEVESGEQLYQYISDYNVSLSGNDISIYPKFNNKPNEKAFAKATQYGFYIGMFNNYDWLSNLINIKNIHQNNNKISSSPKENLKNIQSSVLNSSMKDYNPKNKRKKDNIPTVIEQVHIKKIDHDNVYKNTKKQYDLSDITSESDKEGEPKINQKPITREDDNIKKIIINTT